MALDMHPATVDVTASLAGLSLSNGFEHRDAVAAARGNWEERVSERRSRRNVLICNFPPSGAVDRV